MPRDPSPREELLQIQKKIFARNSEIIRSQTLIQERGFEAYERRYKRYVRNYRRTSNVEELMEEVLKADLIYLGDYHTNQQSQRMLLRLLKLLVEKKDEIVVGLELVQRRHQKVLDAFMQEKITEETFLNKIRFQKYWYYDLWENFKPVFDFARHHQIPLFGIEWSLSGDVSLERRDEKSAKIIASLVRKFPGKKFIIFVGDLHIAPPHLPDRVQRELGKNSKKDLILCQNSEAIYWKLAEEGIEDKTEIVRMDDRSFCILNTPPIVWQQSYLNWLEHEGGEIDYADAKHNFLDLLKQISDFLEIEVGPEREEVEVFTSGDLSFLRRLAEDGSFSKREIRQIKRQILTSESYFIPRRRCVYLGSLSINHASEEASHFLKFLCSGDEFPRDRIDAFYANTLHEALGFFGSKIINHKRKCFHEKEYHDLTSYLRTAKRRGREGTLQLEMALLILDHKRLEKKGDPTRSRKFFRSTSDLFFGVTHGLGYMLGDRLYYALLSDRITKEEIRPLFFNPMKKQGEPFEIYMRLSRQVKGVKLPRRV